MNALRSLKLSHRFAVLIGIFALGFAVYGAWSFKTLADLKVNGPVYQRIVQGKDLIADILPPPAYIIESYLVGLQLSIAEDKKEQGVLVERLKTLKDEYDSRHAFWPNENLDANIAEVFLKQSRTPALQFYDVAFKELVPAVERGNRDEVASAVAKMNAAYAVHRKAIDNVVALTMKRNEIDEAAARAQIDSASWLLLAILVGSVGAGIAVAAIIVRGLLRELGGEPSYAAEITRRIAGADLSSDIVLKKDDEESLLYAMKSMQDMLGGIVSGIKVAVESVSTAAHQISAGNADLSSRTEHEASSLEETAASMEELTGTTRNNSDHASQANALASTASAVAVKGGGVVRDVVVTMQSIESSAKKIVDIISVIDGIAFQTNILALNAAVEAARAGEQGRGFAVVASEVRTLAQRSASAAKEIKALIGESVEKVGAGTRLVNDAGSTMDEVVTSIQRVSAIIAEIATASQEQQSGIEQVNQAIAQMDQVTQQNAALVEEASNAARMLQDQAIHLAQSVSRFKLGQHSPVAGRHLAMA